jgi:hypothetical protein
MLKYAQTVDYSKLSADDRESLEQNGVNKNTWGRFQEIIKNSLDASGLATYLENTEENISNFRLNGNSLSDETKNELRKSRTKAFASVIPNDPTRTIFLTRKTNNDLATTFVHEFSHFDVAKSNDTYIRGTRDAFTGIENGHNFTGAIYSLYMYGP